MFRRKNKQHASERSTEYASCKDFQQIFAEDMVGLHRLAFLLTADEAKAEQCFVGGLEESIHGNPVFRQWARAWSKRAIIQNAIKMIAPSPEQRQPVQEKTIANPLSAGPSNGSGTDVSQWAPFERFVFVMAVLEGYSLRECAALLGCPVQDVTAAKSLALQRLGEQPWQEPATAKRNDIPWTGKLVRAQVA